jgi:flagellar hook-basal body complex protein FliE
MAQNLGLAHHGAGHTDRAIELIEETAFSLALPPALKNIERRCVYVQNDLQQSRAGQPVIAAEMAVERDLKDLIETFKELQSSTAQPSQCKGCKGDRNKLLAELKVLKMLQVRVNEETKDADGSRAAALQELPAALKQTIGSVRDNQQQVHDATEAIHKKICPDCLNEN